MPSDLVVTEMRCEACGRCFTCRWNPKYLPDGPEPYCGHPECPHNPWGGDDA